MANDDIPTLQPHEVEPYPMAAHDRIEYGITLPNGFTYWDGDARNRFGLQSTDSLTSIQVQGKVLDRFRTDVEGVGIKYSATKHGKPLFVTRTRQVRFTEAKPIETTEEA